MYKEREGDLLSSGAEVLINTVNLNGIMGKGIALQFKETYPENFKVYAEACKNKTIDIGKLLVVPTSRLDVPTKYIVNFPTKKDFKHKSKLEYIEKGLEDLSRLLPNLNAKSVAIPPLGCGLGGLDWNDVKPIIKKFTEQFDKIDFFVYEPSTKVYESLAQLTNPNKVIRLTPIRTAILQLFKAYLVMDFEITVIEINKIVYFLNRMGFPFERLEFQKGVYGPYAPKLKYILQDLDGGYINGMKFQKARIFDELHLKYERLPEIDEAYSKLPLDNQTVIQNAIALIDGFETPHGMELLATVDWVQANETGFDAPLENVIEAVHNWNDRKRRFMSPYQIQVSMERLKEFSEKFD